MNTIRIVCRQSKLSLLQANIVKKQISLAVPGIHVQVEGIISRGDRESSIALQTVEGKDFFTEDITRRLKNGGAVLAVHSLKDLSSEHFFSHTTFAIPDRNTVHDVALFVADIEEKIYSKRHCKKQDSFYFTIIGIYSNNAYRTKPKNENEWIECIYQKSFGDI